MTLRNIGLHLHLLIAALLLGTALRQQFDLLNYFYENNLVDWAPVFLILIASFAVAVKYIDLKGSVSVVISLLFLATIFWGFELVFWVYGYVDWSNIVSYTTLSILAATMGIFIKSRNFQLTIWFIPIAALAFWAGYYPLTKWLFIPFATLHLLNDPLYEKWKKSGLWATGILIVILISAWIPNNTRMYESQKRYYDKVLYSAQTPYHQIDITTWKGHEWFYYDNINQFSSIDRSLYFEPMVHPAMEISSVPKKILIIGGENGLLVNEVLKHKDVTQIDLAPVDTALLSISTKLNWFTNLNNHSLKSDKLKVRHGEIFRLLASDSSQYDLVFVDVPDPVDIELSQYYTVEFYELCHKALNDNGLLVTQAGSPYLATVAFYTIDYTIKAARFTTLPLHNQVLTIGEWGWIIGAKDISETELHNKARQCTFEGLNTKWINHEAMQLVMSFGKPPVHMDTFDINTLKKPVIHEYYKSGTWIF
ncbi:hypothetical protein JMN32_12450 [Fulvivirga sp. 29W222]|uniref:Polyamine aminopropyltransferase n=1 Tax=Fulvivirga marina TaxID=2494733 RepID=A0A937KC92_9BACT|nr:hypothetical protein [Fulvivirga marina]MBL6447124.1 hypothetical protein [Fulvivirga marina]